MGIFLDILKAFDKVWHEGLMFKLKSYGIDGDLLKLFINYLEDRKGRVVLNGQDSFWKNILAGVPQGSVLGPILFLIYTNNFGEGNLFFCCTGPTNLNFRQTKIIIILICYINISIFTIYISFNMIIFFRLQ